MKAQRMLGFNHMEFWRKLGPFACSNSSEIFWNSINFLCCIWFFKLDVEFSKGDNLTEKECNNVIDALEYGADEKKFGKIKVGETTI